MRYVVVINTDALRAAEQARTHAEHAAGEAREAERSAERTAHQWQQLAQALEGRVRALEDQVRENSRREDLAQQHIRWLVTRNRELENALLAAGVSVPSPATPEPFTP